MSIQEPSQREAYNLDDQLTILETVRQQNTVRLSALATTLSLDDEEISRLLDDLRAADLVSYVSNYNGDDMIVNSLPRLREYERTKVHRLLDN